VDKIKWSRLERLVARVAGDEPVPFLDATTTQDLTGLSPNQGVLTCMLDEKGHVQAELRVTVLDDGTTLIDAEQAARDAITGWLAKIAPLSGCEVIEETARWHVTALFGVNEAPDGAIGLASDWGPSNLDVLTASAFDFGGEEIGAADYEAARIAAGRPRFGVDFDASTHIAETPLLARAVSFTKGCYPGQESVARVNNLGHARKRLVGLDVEGSAAPRTGSTLTVDEREVGRVTSAAAWDGRIVAIASLRSDVHDGVTVDVGGAPAVVRAL
jgi:folate-binding protein YgfZ